MKGNETYNNMLANILPLHLPFRSILFLFLKVVMLHIKLTGMKHRTPQNQIFCPFTHSGPLDGVKRSKHFFLKNVLLHFKLKGKKCRTLHVCSDTQDGLLVLENWINILW